VIFQYMYIMYNDQSKVILFEFFGGCFFLGGVAILGFEFKALNLLDRCATT
jgi:hypothetical protein